ncbi:MAG: hypothetical protein SOT57_04975 [Eubacteriales bacterium]|nr:hypothetical protein [Eubacteriales bacterium]
MTDCRHAEYLLSAATTRRVIVQTGGGVRLFQHGASKREKFDIMRRISIKIRRYGVRFLPTEARSLNFAPRRRDKAVSISAGYGERYGELRRCGSGGALRGERKKRANRISAGGQSCSALGKG